MNERTMSVRQNEVTEKLALGWEVHPEQINNPLGLVRLRRMVDLNREMACAARYYRKHGE